LTIKSVWGVRCAFPPSVVVAIKALACELPHESGKPLSRWSTSEIRREVVNRGLVASIGDSTLWRWLHKDAIRPWFHRSWIFPRAPKFEEQAGCILDLYAGVWKGAPLDPSDCILSTDEKTSIQARSPIHPSLPAAPSRIMRTEHEYERLGAWAYFAAWDVRRAKLFGLCARSTGIVPFERLVTMVMARDPYRTAKRVFWVMDNGSSHRGARCAARLLRKWPTIIPVHTPVHASWLNQIEVYFSIVQRKVLTPSDFSSMGELKHFILSFQKHYEKVAMPFEWKFTRQDLADLMARLRRHESV
jgi:hypothetical protein